MQRAKNFIINDLYQPLIALPWIERLLCVWIGILGGVVPIPAITSFVTGMLAAFMKFNAAQTAIAITINLACTPLQFMLIPYFADSSVLLLPAAFFGSFTSKPSTIIVEALKSGDVVETIKTAGGVIFAATIPWALLTIVSIALFGMIQKSLNQN